MRRAVGIEVESDGNETFDDAPVTRYLTPVEARELAAVLVAAAAEAER